MSKLAQRSDIAYKLNNGQPVDLTVTMENAGAATARLYLNKIIVDLVAAELGKYVNISTPLGFEILDVYVLQESSTACTVQAKNTTGNISDVITVTTDKTLYYATTIDNAQSIFARNDDDLRLYIATGNATAKVIITIEPVVI